MALNLEAKKAVVEQVNAVAIKAVSVGVAEYRGLNVEQMTNLQLCDRRRCFFACRKKHVSQESIS